MPVTDVHQHLWPELAAAAARRAAARSPARRHADGWELELAGEAPAGFDTRAHDPARRATLAADDGLGRVLVAPSSPLGIEALPAHEAQPLLDAFHQGVLELGAPFAPWGAVALAAAEPAAVDALLDLGAAGLCLPGAALGGPAAARRIGPVLERLAQRGAPLFVHPGPAPAGDARLPAWWPPRTSYVSEMQAAWLAWAGWGRTEHPRAQGRVGDARRLRAAAARAAQCPRRSGRGVHDDRAWFDVSSYGPHAVDAMLRVVGVDRLVLGSDRPVADPPALASLGEAVLHAIARVNPAAVSRHDPPATSTRPSSSGSCRTSPPGPSAGAISSITGPTSALTPSCTATSTSAIWLICWMDDHDTGYHDHDLSAGAVAVTQGAVREERLVLGGAPAARTASAGEAFTFGPADIHRVSHAGREPAVTIHAYSPPLWRMGAYEVLPTGELRRWSLSYAEELRPDRGIEKGPLAEKLSPGRGRRGESGSRAGPVA